MAVHGQRRRHVSTSENNPAEQETFAGWIGDSSTIGVVLGNGDGTFGYETEYALPEPPESVVIDDFNHDGKLGVAAVMDTAIAPNTAQVPYIALLTGDGVVSCWCFCWGSWSLHL